MSNNYDIGTHSIQGGRDYQDDYCATQEYPDGSILLLLADGMGGYAGGRIASETVIDAFKQKFDYKSDNIKTELENSLNVANRALANKKEVEDKKYQQMGTTLIAVYMKNDYMQWVSVGDSPLFLIRQDKDTNQYLINRVNKNHSIAGLLELQYKHGEITKEEMEDSPNKHMLTSAVTGDELRSIDLSDKFKLQANDTVILASDGVETLSNEEIKNITLNSKNALDASDRILKAVADKKVENQDNATVVVAKLKKAVHKIINDEEEKFIRPKEEKSYTQPPRDITSNSSNKSLKGIIIGLSALLIGMVGYIGYLKFQGNNSSNKTVAANNTTKPYKQKKPITKASAPKVSPNPSEHKSNDKATANAKSHSNNNTKPTHIVDNKSKQTIKTPTASKDKNSTESKDKNRSNTEIAKTSQTNKDTNKTKVAKLVKESNNTKKADKKKDIDQIIQNLSNNCQKGKVEACYELGLRYKKGDEVKKDTQKASKLFQNACNNGFKKACNEIKDAKKVEENNPKPKDEFEDIKKKKEKQIKGKKDEKQTIYSISVRFFSCNSANGILFTIE